MAFVSKEEIASTTPAEHAVIDRLIERGTTKCGVLDRAILESIAVMCEETTNPTLTWSLIRRPVRQGLDLLSGTHR